jgi:hypothetical protein
MSKPELMNRPALASVRPSSPGHEALRDALLASIDLLHRRRAGEIPEGLIDDYVRLNWLEWHGGGLRVTTTGENICRQLRGRLQ